MRVLVAGAQGMLGHDLLPALREAGHEAIAADLRVTDPAAGVPLDITDLAEVQRVVSGTRPEAIINAAAYTNVDGAETDVERAYAINAGGSWNLALAAQALDIPLLYVSTDYVFDGAKGSAYDEYDLPNPQSVYGRSKRAGEIHVERLCRRHYIARTAWLYGAGGKNFVETILQAAKDRPELKVVNDQWGCPTWTKDLSRAIVDLLDSDRYGTYHVTGQGVCTWMEFAQAIVKLGGMETPVRSQTTQELGRPAPRPTYSAMRSRGLELAGIDLLPAWEDSLRQYFQGRRVTV